MGFKSILFYLKKNYVIFILDVKKQRQLQQENIISERIFLNKSVKHLVLFLADSPDTSTLNRYYKPTIKKNKIDAEF